MGIAEILALLSWLFKNEGSVIEFIQRLLSLFGEPGTPTDAEMLAKRIAEYVHVAVPAWRSVWTLDFGQGEEGNVRARELTVYKQVHDYALDWKNERLTHEQLEMIVRTARGLACLKG